MFWGGRAGLTQVGAGHGSSGFGASLPIATSAAPPELPGPPALDSPVTPVPALAAIAPAVSHPAPRGKGSDYPNTVIKGEMCF